MKRDAYASYNQYETMQRALNNIQISKDTLNKMIEMDRDLLNAGDVLEALELGGEKCAYCLHQGRELVHSIETKFRQQLGWLGRRQFFELVQLCRFAEDLMNRDDYIYESEASEVIERLDQFDPSIAVSTDEIVEQYPISVMLPDVMEFMDGTHKICKNYLDFLKSGHGKDEEPLREERLAEDV